MAKRKSQLRDERRPGHISVHYEARWDGPTLADDAEAVPCPDVREATPAEGSA